MEAFERQLHYIRENYNPITMQELFSFATLHTELPDNPLLLTFDDGYLEHFTNVFPLLNRLNLQGSFFPPAETIIQNKVLNVNKIHFILNEGEAGQIMTDILSMIQPYRNEYSLKEDSFYIESVCIADEYDLKEVVFIKLMLGRELPKGLRDIIADELFKKYVCADEKVIAKELYMNTEQMKLMKRMGMYFGGHSYGHDFMETLSVERQIRDLELSMQFLEDLGCDMSEWAMAYPYGTLNENLLTLLRDRNCKVAFIDYGGVADLENDDHLSLPRIDTIHLN